MSLWAVLLLLLPVLCSILQVLAGSSTLRVSLIATQLITVNIEIGCVSVLFAFRFVCCH
jgi:hypothetical protein